VGLVLLAGMAPVVACGQSLHQVMREALSGQSGAAVVVRVRDRRVLASVGEPLLRLRVATPGSTVKPFVLQLMLEQGAVKPDEKLACRRDLSIAGHSLRCSHPDELGTFQAADALAWSCNSYFATAAARLRPGELERRFAELGFTRPSGLMAAEGAGRVRAAATLQEQQLLAIGAAGVQVTPLELASAYAQLAKSSPQGATPAGKVVLAGLRLATEYGLAANAAVPKFPVAGKTGTASDPGNPQTHAWFAGFAPADHPEIVVVVFLERGRGSVEAATIARKIFEAYAAGPQR
jgi:cell division protein FtsI/penicillin-binding protein 2